ncbi:MAG: hypothetical protein A3I77_02605 [Gammaproteobacteria bacterium RIFCSPLOWO2_02_FULL_42_14]|nr:MAG: hypothetical protein A3B71_02445 [Gammaproteobacteria bacterium RIFCSPHIGHO2_02_FULL_42_43]OGT28646.1 MAG: hypothetical protein A2624_05655 [Gammaproteobacteria bacterium RIFCSPHIGHO2_01_FULL_42_8]OGT53542.1 MAG: hypothetical protein A3E54_02470 [Gammaproteobacteria bacterium RIFCSPHIGHO2_12_FULL_41_25]OGT61486.1 MAG: hypothetical protein A3I77_02605 [Gammaproteobacteria bacterium RIFCSPLOWO2_02_FULL_42_14]OGT86746.1 MAG: hypothetical protein A3G86_05275 [Gammaproteobacteria bacterium R
MSDDILFHTETDCDQQKLGKITLNRASALNALNGDMFHALEAQLLAWQTDSAIKAVLIRSNSDKAFCAGGDIRAIYDNRSTAFKQCQYYFRLEYNINRLISHFQKPFIALTHGITMGGGVGISLHGSHCVAAPDLRWAMPETGIGFFPDVGVSFHFSRLPNHLGAYLALTGSIISAEDAYYLHFSPFIVTKEKFDALERKLIDTPLHDRESVTKIIAEFSEKMIVNKLKLQREEIARCFCFDTVEKIFAALKKENTSFAEETVLQLQKRSPTSLKVTLKQLQLAKNKTLDEVIEMDYRIACHMLTQHDFMEGIRAAIIDKDKNPRWNPRNVDAVSSAEIETYFK